MEIAGYLIIKKGERWGSNSARFTKKKPALGPREIAIKIECEVPDALFSQPQLKFKINIPKEAVPQKEISADVVGNIRDLIQQNTGLDIRLISETVQMDLS